MLAAKGWFCIQDAGGEESYSVLDHIDVRSHLIFAEDFVGCRGFQRFSIRSVRRL